MSIDQRLRALERAARDDEDELTAVRIVNERARLEGSSARMAPLLDRQLWTETSAALQDLAIQEAARHLGPAFGLIGTRWWFCRNESESWPGASGQNLPMDAKPFEQGYRLATFRHLMTGMEMQLVPGGQVMVNKDGSTNFARGDLVHLATIEPFLIGRWPVTVRQYIAGMWGDAEPCDLPQTSIPHTNTEGLESASLFVSKCGLRLPSDREWEYACRAGTTTRFYWGSEMRADHCWCLGNSGRADNGNLPFGRIVGGGPMNDRGAVNAIVFFESDQTRREIDFEITIDEIGEMLYIDRQQRLTFDPGDLGHPPRAHDPAEHDRAGFWNPFGLVDMIGNVREYTSTIEDGEHTDEHGERYRYDSGSNAILMGGSFNHRADLFTAGRGFHYGRWGPSMGSDDVGFRAAASVPGWPP